MKRILHNKNSDKVVVFYTQPEQQTGDINLEFKDEIKAEEAFNKAREPRPSSVLGFIKDCTILSNNNNLASSTL